MLNDLDLSRDFVVQQRRADWRKEVAFIVKKIMITKITLDYNFESVIRIMCDFLLIMKEEQRRLSGLDDDRLLCSTRLLFLTNHMSGIQLDSMIIGNSNFIFYYFL